MMGTVYFLNFPYSLEKTVPRYTTVRRSIHTDAGYKPINSYGFASQLQTIPVLHKEVAHISQQMAVAFQLHGAGTPSEHYELIAIQSLEPGKNLFITPDGRWITGYQPEFYKSYPFAYIGNSETNQAELHIDEDVIIEQAAIQPTEEVIRLFNDEGNLNDPVRQTVDALNKAMQERSKTLTLCRELHEAGVICPWDIKFHDLDPPPNSKPQIKVMQGLNHINQTALQELPADTLAQLNQSGALHLAYGQLLSEPRLGLMGLLAAAQRKMAPQAQLLDETDLDDLFGEKDDLFSF